MSGFISAFQLASLFLPTWFIYVILAILAVVALLLVLRVVGAILDAIPFV